MKNIIIFILLIFITACNNSSSANISENTNETASITNNIYSNKTLKVGIYFYDYPMVYVSNDNINGFDYDIINSIANEENFKLEFIPIQFSKLIPSLNTNYIDIIIAGMSITEDRKQLVNFSDKYCSSGQGIILNKENDEIKVNDDLIGKTVGVIKGTISDNIISEVEGVNI
ncbi:transporter substrate-binding domain-containing protein [Brachyspira intermedia]|uniref:transporter substrate-binding domain-containing protein n=1 Tax=Brachyspira intermedia TaxID=84377 RepID=UPI003B5C35B5